MGDFKYQMSIYNLFDYTGVERHLEKMAAKGWRFTSIGNFFWVYRRTEPAKVKYSVTYVPEASQFDPQPLEKQRDIEAYCEEAGWKKVDTWMQMQIFCSENPDAVPIDTDEEVRLEAIHKSMKKNFLFSHLLLLIVFLMNAFTNYGLAKRNWMEFLSDSGRLWTCGIWFTGILVLTFDIIYYYHWLYKARKRVKVGLNCPEPKAYRYIAWSYWIILIVCTIGLFSSYTAGKGFVMAIYLALFFVIVAIVRRIQERLKREGVSKSGNAAITMGSSVLLTFLMIGGLVVVFVLFGVGTKGRTVDVDVIEINGQEWNISHDTVPLPLYVEDFAEGEGKYSSRWAIKDQESIAAGYGEYQSELFIETETGMEIISIYYDAVTVKLPFLYDFLLKAFYEQEFRYAKEGDQEKTEYRVTYEGEAGTMYRQYYEGLPMAHDWLVLTDNRIVSLRMYPDNLDSKQMQCIVETLAK